MLGPSATVLVSLLQPSLSINGDGLGVTIDGQTQENTISLAGNLRRPGYQMYGTSQPAQVLVSRKAHNDGFESLADQALNSEPELVDPSTGTAGTPADVATTRTPQEKPYAFVQTELPVTNWSAQWLAYSSFDGIVVTVDDLQQMPPPVQAAVWKYVECGGALFVWGSWAIPQPWQPESSEIDPFMVAYPGFGQCIVSREADLKQLTQSQWNEVVASWGNTPKPWQSPKDVAEANRVFPVIEQFGIPVRGLFLLMLVFVAIIGPVNLVMLSRRRKRIWFLWTVPAISLVTCVAVSGYSILSEGWKGHARVEGVTILDEISHRATTIGWMGFYSALTPGEGLHLSPETEVTPQVSSAYYYRGGGTSRTMDWTHDQHLASGWVTARVPAHFMIRKSEVRRERLTIRTDSDGSLKAVNGLGADIQTLWLMDKNKKLFKSNRIAAGGQAVLTPYGEMSSGIAPDRLRSIFAAAWITAMKTVQGAAQLRPGSYTAVMDSNPFIEEGLKLESRTARTVVYGIME